MFDQITDFQVTQLSTSMQRSSLSFIPEQSGSVYCAAENSEGKHDASISFLLTDLDEPFSIWSGDKYSAPASAGDSFSLNCGLTRPESPATLNFYKDNELVENSTGKQKDCFSSERRD